MGPDKLGTADPIVATSVVTIANNDEWEMNVEIRVLVKRRQKAYLAKGQSGSVESIGSIAGEVESFGILTIKDLLTAIETRSLNQEKLARLVCLATKIVPNAVAPALVDILGTTRSRSLWFQAATGLGYLKLKVGKQTLIRALLTNPNPWKRMTAAYALTFRSRWNADVMDALVKSAKVDSSTKVRARAIESLHVAPKRVIPDLRLFLRDRNPTVRFWACYVLSQLGGQKEIQLLSKSVDDKGCPKDTGMNRTVGQEAQWAIEHIRERLAWRKALPGDGSNVTNQRRRVRGRKRTS